MMDTIFQSLSLLDLVENQTMDLRTSALFWLLAERKASVIVASPPRLAGKSTVLDAILQMAPSSYEIVTTKGLHEDFTFLSRTEPKNTYILVPEISDHLPIYLWGDKVRTVFEALSEGYSLAATMHAGSPSNAVAQLRDGEIGLAPEHISQIDVVVNLYMGESNQHTIRRVEKVSIQSPDLDDSGNLSFVPIAAWDPERDTMKHENEEKLYVAIGKRLDMTCDEFRNELSLKQKTLKSWLESGLTSIGLMKERLRAYYSSK